MRSAAYETDSVELLGSGIGRFTFHVEVRHANRMSATKTVGSGEVVGKKATSAAAPTTMTAAT